MRLSKKWVFIITVAWICTLIALHLREKTLSRVGSNLRKIKARNTGKTFVLGKKTEHIQVTNLNGNNYDIDIGQDKRLPSISSSFAENKTDYDSSFFEYLDSILVSTGERHAGREDRQEENQTQDMKTQAVQHKVIILTYMRSGSTLTGDLLQQNPNVFYVFEPLWMTERMFKSQRQPPTYRLLNNTHVSIPKTKNELADRYTQVVEAFLGCRFHEIDVLTLTQYFMKLSYSTKDFKTCVQDNVDLRLIEYCIKPLYTKCMSSRVVVVKVIRFSMKQARSIMASDKAVKIIHLIRDPRGTLQSQQSVRYFQWGNLHTAAAYLCNRQEIDVWNSRQFSATYPNRILTVRYEDIADFPVEAAKQLYSFLNLDLTSKIEQYIWHITYAGHQDMCFLCTSRKNATVTANSWRRKLLLPFLNVIQIHCSTVINLMGYKRFDFPQDMTDLQRPARLHIYGPGLMKVQVNGLYSESRFRN